MTATVDTTVLHQRIRDWAQIVGVTVHDALMYHAGLLKWELMAGAPPKSLSKSRKKAERDTKKVFFPRPKEFFSTKKQRGQNGMTWLYAAPNALVGAQTEDYRPEITLTDMTAMRDRYWNSFRGAAWHDKGQVQITRNVKANRFTRRSGRGVTQRTSQSPQHAMIINRIVVKRSNFSRYKSFLAAQFGRLKAAWAVGMEKFPIAHSRAIPAWIRRHIPKAKGSVNLQLDGPLPFVEISNFSPGVEHDRALANVRRAVKKRAGAIKKDLSLYLQGIKKAADFKMPSLFKPTALWLLIAPLGIALDAHGIPAAPAHVADGGGIAQYQSLAQRSANGEEDFAQVKEILDRPAFDWAGDAITRQHAICLRHPARPSAGRIRHVKDHEPDLRRPFPELRGHPGRREVIPAGPQFAIQPDAGGQLIGERARRFDAVAIARPQAVAIPERPATVQLFAEPPAREIGLAVPIPQQRHVAFIHAPQPAKPAWNWELEKLSPFVIGYWPLAIGNP